MRTLSNLRDELLDRLNFASQAGADVATVRLANSFLRNAQTFLYWQYDFADLRYTWTLPLAAGTSSYAYPANKAAGDGIALESRRIISVSIQDGTRRSMALREGIAPSMYNDTAQGEPTHYERRAQLEFFRVPDKAYTAHIDGYRKLAKFTEDGDVCTVDDELVFMLGLANGKAHYRQPDAQIYAQELQSLLARLKGYDHGGRRHIPGMSDDATAAAQPKPAAPFPQ